LNWPWPLDSVQGWFESLWNQVSTAAVNAVSVVSDWIWSAIYWVRDRISEGITSAQDYLWDKLQWLKGFVEQSVGWVWDQVKPLLRPVVDWVEVAAGWAWSTLWNFVKDPVGTMSNAWQWIVTNIWDKIQWLREQISQGWTWLNEEIRKSYSSVTDFISQLWAAIKTEVGNVAKTVSNSVTGLWDSLTGLAGDILAGVTEALGSGLQGFFDWILKHLTWFSQMVIGAVNSVIAAIHDFAASLVRRFIDTMTGALSPGSPDKEIETAVTAMVQTFTKRSEEIIKKMYKSPADITMAPQIAAELLTTIMGADVAVQSTGLAADQAHPAKNMGFRSIAESISRTLGIAAIGGTIARLPIEIGLFTQLRYYYQEAFTPYLPSYGDMIRIFVREGYRPEYQTEIPDGMIPSFRKLGYSEYWAKALWGAHWVLPSVGQVFEMLHRGIEMPMSVPEFLKTADYHPDWREPLIKLSWDLPGRIDARWMAGWDVIDVDEYGDLLVKRGLDPEWRDRVTYATLRQQNASYINKCRDNAKNDFVKGYITEEQLRADLEALEFSPERIEWIVQDALHDREIAHKEKLLDIYQDGYVKDLVTDEELAAYAAEIIVDEEALKLYLDESYVRKYRKPKAS